MRYVEQDETREGSSIIALPLSRPAHRCIGSPVHRLTRTPVHRLTRSLAHPLANPGIGR
jgi:hypothetical protein